MDQSSDEYDSDEDDDDDDDDDDDEDDSDAGSDESEGLSWEELEERAKEGLAIVYSPSAHLSSLSHSLILFPTSCCTSRRSQEREA